MEVEKSTRSVKLVVGSELRRFEFAGNSFEEFLREVKKVCKFRIIFLII
jgi:hypothetical protein